MPQVNTIRAKPIPMTSAVLLMDKMKVDAEEKRKREHAERTATLLQKSKLPKRMEGTIGVKKEVKPESLLVK